MQYVTEIIEFGKNILGVLVILIGIPAGATWGVLKLFGEKLLSARIERNMSAMRHEYAKELEKIRLLINTRFDRVIKIHEKEFEIIPELWGKINTLYLTCVSLTSSVKSYADISSLSDEKIVEFLRSISMHEWQIEEVINSDDKFGAYKKFISQKEVRAAKEMFFDFQDSFGKNIIFVPQEIKSKIEALSKLCWDTVIEYEINLHEDVIPKHREMQSKLLNEGQMKRSETEEAIYVYIRGTES